jgi:hypothetical protein
MSLDFNGKNGIQPHDPNIDTSLSLNPPTSLASPLQYDPPPSPSLEANQVTDQTYDLSHDPSSLSQDPQQHQPQPPQHTYTPAKLFQATGDVRNLARSNTSPSGLTVQIYDRHTRTWVPDINFTDIAIRGQLYILWKTAWSETSSPIDRELILDAAASTLRDIQKDNNKWERNYSAARRRDWHPNFTTFYDDIFKGVWVHRIWSSPESLPEPPRYLAEMARKLTKNAGAAAGMNIHQTAPVVGDTLDGEISMSPVALRTLKLRVIELEGINQGLREELGMLSRTNYSNYSAIRRGEGNFTTGK